MEPQTQATETRKERGARSLTLHEAALVSGRSVQTIRRLIKIGRVKARRKRTPQGFQYTVDRESLMTLAQVTTRFIPEETEDTDVQTTPLSRVAPTIEEKEEPNITPVPADTSLLLSLHQTIRDLLEHQTREREQFLLLLRNLQERITFLEEQARTILRKKKKWYHFF